jgi:hypothetical protein
MLKNRVVLTIVAILLLVGVVIGQETLTNDSVVEMVTAGLPDEIIIAKINSSKTSFDLSTPALAKLTQAKVSSAVMKAMIEPKTGDPGTPAATAVPAPTNPDDPMAPHDPGIYLMKITRDGGKEMVQLERAGSGHEKTANTWGHAFSYGIAKAKVKAELPGRQAATRSNQEKPEFYMYFPPTGNLGAADTISSPPVLTSLARSQERPSRNCRGQNRVWKRERWDGRKTNLQIRRG